MLQSRIFQIKRRRNSIFATNTIKTFIQNTETFLVLTLKPETGFWIVNQVHGNALRFNYLKGITV